MVFRWALFLFSTVIPSFPVIYLIFESNLADSLFLSGYPILMMSYCVLWLVLGGIGFFHGLQHSRQPDEWDVNLTFLCCLILLFIPIFLTGIWVFSGPVLNKKIFLIFSLTCLFPLGFHLAWEFTLKKSFAGVTWIEFLLPVASVLLLLGIFEVFSRFFLNPDLFKNNLAISSPDKSYWYIVRKMAGGVNQANSHGFLGPEPEANSSQIRVILIGDSIPASERSINFPNVAEDLYEKELGRERRIEIVNASIGSFSVDQIYRYYSEKLKELSHNFLIFSFYLDDVNRPLKYRKNNYLYTPNWPEWMQDVYYQCHFCRLLLNLCGFTENAFLTYRTRSYEEAFPEALDILNKTRLVADSRGAKFAVLNIPRLNWANVLSNISGYRYLEINRALEAWCKVRSVPYHDVLPLLVGKDITKLRISRTDIHFTDLGHKHMGAELKDFLVSLIGSENISHNQKGPSRS